VDVDGSSGGATDWSAQIAVTLSGLEGDDHPGGGGMIPSGTEDDVELEPDPWTWTNGDVGLDVKMNEGNKAICCSL
jgi:hypothetical protein